MGLDWIARPKEQPPGREAGPDWALGLNGPSFRAGPAKERTGPRPVSQGRSGSGGQRRPRSCGRRFSPLDAAMRAGMDAGDGSGHRLGFAVVDRGLTGV
ncbi:hypothetical protein CDL15_Pgr024742 [Punica granatum]|uniref:Uncharacterized protein n=1 Tax=Punica granatum TaxID=22663 RepID=A0A218W475_PUNGR|nr:hypothetical protein CDL15_Pgr024742 [Punica granatum]